MDKIFLIFLFLAMSAQAGQFTVSWQAPTEREDGTPLSISEIDGYRVYYGTETGVYTNMVDVSGGSTLKYTQTDLQDATYYVVVTAIDTGGRESGYSDEAFKEVATSPPKPPMLMSVTE